MTNNKRKPSKRWTADEDKILLQQIDAFPHNLSKCFMVVSEMTGRSKNAVQAHWYTVLSKRDDVWKFVTLSASHCSKNRKNGAGEQSSVSIWNKVLSIVKALFK